jgi:proteasome accessory factor B
VRSDRPGASSASNARVAALLDATLRYRRVAMRYHSFSSNRDKEYLIEPLRLVFAQGGLYLVAFVPEYDHLRTFSIDRILHVSLTEERFEPKALPDDPFAHSLGVHEGTPERVEIAFDADMARYVKERVWHPSQELREEPDGRVILTLTVSIDWALRSWILGFGPLARVLAPANLAAQIVEEVERTRSQYVPRLE